MDMYYNMHFENLVDNLAKHVNSLSVNKNHFFSILSSHKVETNLGLSYCTINSDNNRSQELNNTYLSIDGLIYNLRFRDVFRGDIPLITPTYDGSKRNIWNDLKKYLPQSNDYSTDEVLKNLANQKDIVDAMVSYFNKGSKFTLLGRLNTVDYSAPNSKVTIYTMPVLVTSLFDAKSENLIHQWELSNMKKETCSVKKYFGLFSF